MGFCSVRNICLANCCFQMMFAAFRQVFDFLGYMWGPILANFFQIIFIIFGFFGVYQFRLGYIIVDSDWLSLGTGSVSWWESNGPGCKPQFLANLSTLEVVPWRPLRPDSVSGCLILYHYFEAAQALFHLILGIIGLISSSRVSWFLLDEETSSQPGKKKKSDSLPPLYSIQYSTRQSPGDIDNLSVHELPEEDTESRLPSPRPMTPRRVKRRSVNSRGVPLQRSMGHSSHNMYSLQRHSTHSRSSHRSSQHKRASHQNPVTRLIDQQQKQDVSRLVGHTNPVYQQSSTNSLDQDCDRPPSARSVYSNYHGTRAFSYLGSQNPPSTFLSRGPPAYNLHSPLKTETVI